MDNLSIAAIAARLAENAEAVCRAYLPAGRREGRYWIAGDVTGTPGRSLYVRLVGGDSGKAGKWSDAATGEHGDLVDLIRLNRGLAGTGEALGEALHFLRMPLPQPRPENPKALTASHASHAARLWHASVDLHGTPAQDYLASRGLGVPPGDNLRYLGSCPFREGARLEFRPAMIAAVFDDRGLVCGVHRTALTNSKGLRRALGRVHGHGLRFGNGGVAPGTMIAGEGIETTLSVAQVLPGVPAVAALSAGHLGGLILPPSANHILIAVDDDPAGHAAARRLRSRALEAETTVTLLYPRRDDFNSDLLHDGADQLRASILRQLKRAGLPLS